MNKYSVKIIFKNIDAPSKVKAEIRELSNFIFTINCEPKEISNEIERKVNNYKVLNGIYSCEIEQTTIKKL